MHMQNKFRLPYNINKTQWRCITNLIYKHIKKQRPEITQWSDSTESKVKQRKRWYTTQPPQSTVVSKDDKGSYIWS